MKINCSFYGFSESVEIDFPHVPLKGDQVYIDDSIVNMVTDLEDESPYSVTAVWYEIRDKKAMVYIQLCDRIREGELLENL